MNTVVQSGNENATFKQMYIYKYIYVPLKETLNKIFWRFDHKLQIAGH